MGGAAVVGGVVMFLVGGSDRTGEDAPAPVAKIIPSVGPGGASITLHWAF